MIGATVGALIPLLFIELYGFHGTLKIGASLNLLLAIVAFALSLSLRPGQTPALSSTPAAEEPELRGQLHQGRMQIALLFATGLTSMGMEVVWINLSGLDFYRIQDLSTLDQEPYWRAPADLGGAGSCPDAFVSSR